MIDISSWLVTKFKAELINDNWQFNCPFCNDSKNHMGYHVEKSVVNCFKCSYSNSIINFMMEIEDKTVGEVWQIIKTMPRIDRYQQTRYKPSILKDDLTASKHLLYKPITKSNLNGSYTVKIALRYLKKRNIHINDVERWGLGLSDNPMYQDRIIIPFIEDGKLIYFQARTIKHNNKMKYLFPPNNTFSVGKSDLLYNIGMASRFDEVNIVEGVFDVYGAGKNSVAILGKKMSNTQIAKLLYTGFKRVKIIFDSGDIEYKAAIELAGQLNELIPTKIVRLRKGDPSSNKGISNSTTKNYSFKEHLRMKMSK